MIILTQFSIQLARWNMCS